MARARKEKNQIGELLGILFSIMTLFSFWVWSKTLSIAIAITVFIFGNIALFGIRHLFELRRNQKFLDSGLDIVDKMSGIEFEEFLLAHFKNLGYKVRLTSGSGDYGADLVLEKNGRVVVVQAKRWNQTVGIDAVQQVGGAIKYYNANKGIVITNNYFSENAYELADSSGIELWDRPKLIEIMSKSSGSQLAKRIKNPLTVSRQQIAATSTDTCPQCGSKLLLKNGKYGEFWGCSKYPDCRYSKNKK